MASESEPTMGIRALVERLGTVSALDSLGQPLAAIVNRALPPGPVRDALRGRWLGHRLHPMLTDAPIGFWTSGVVLDVAGGPRSRPAADALLGLGVATALPTAAAGATDWSEASTKTRRQGVVHALANTAALGLFAASLLARRHDRRKGVRLALLAESCLLAGGYIGGHLAYAEGVGVSARAASEPAGDPAAPG